MKKINKMIMVNLGFWTSGIELKIDGERLLACKDSGKVNIRGNSSKGICSNGEIFASYEDIIPAIKKLFRKNKIHVVSNNRRPRVK